jgi:cell wall-associated NlpC family hydrolase
MPVKVTRYIAYLFVLLCLIFYSCKSGKGKLASKGKSTKSWKQKGKTSTDAAGTVKVNISSKEIEKVIQTARSYRGTPHRDGGTSRLGIDCSALVQISYQSIGFQLPRTSKEQSTVGKEIPKSQIKPGDLVFFADRKIGRGITHVGMVTEVKGEDQIKFIHTSSKLGVTENLLSSAYFKNTFVKAVRPY